MNSIILLLKNTKILQKSNVFLFPKTKNLKYSEFPNNIELVLKIL